MIGAVMPVEFISASDMVAPTDGQYEMADIKKVVSKHAKRLGVDEDIAMNNAVKFAEMVGMMENNGQLEGTNVPQKGKEASTAKGLYQFLDDSVGPAKNRLARTVDVSDMPDDPNDMTWNQQTSLMLADVLEKTAVVGGKKIKGLGDKLMKRVLENANDTEAVKEAYYVLHHTNPDEKTKAMADRRMSEPLY